MEPEVQAGYISSLSQKKQVEEPGFKLKQYASKISAHFALMFVLNCSSYLSECHFTFIKHIQAYTQNQSFQQC